MSDIVIRADGLGKRYVIDHQVERVPYTALRDVISEAASSFLTSVLRLSRPRLSLKTKEEFWALRDLTFEIQRGDVVGVVGRNGAGKSTLLRILSRITEPTEGRVTIAGRVASLLEVGTGFHPELTGRENIYLNGAILGMSRAEVRSKFDEIVHFADVERFLDTPVKRFSSGMYMRLAFAVAAFLESDILIVDEVLAVGDAAFQRKCLGRMGDVSASGRTVLFVSHNIGSLLSICHKGILLDAGRLAATGDMRSIAQAYQKLGETGGTILGKESFSGPLTSIEFERLELEWEALNRSDVCFSGSAAWCSRSPARACRTSRTSGSASLSFERGFGFSLFTTGPTSSGKEFSPRLSRYLRVSCDLGITKSAWAGAVLMATTGSGGEISRPRP